MSRIGKQTIILPDKVSANINESIIFIEGPKGKLSYKLSQLIDIQQKNNEITLKINKSNKASQELHGLSRTIINNMALGVSQGFFKKLEIHGVGYRAQINNKELILNVGYSHPVKIDAPSGISIKVEKNTDIIVSGISKEIVGQVAAKIRSVKPPEPYKGKGIRYINEKIKRKVGKAGK
ncbi:50S ribosomal protein L6 (plastid) [Chondrus crispus]|uniref:50S ribosomal protein L6 n=1 Tax=Chondrus crispus TaxID=2769 RepID=M5DER9_CHOCR|nr:50S ribosomal protein L6 [Chondrus crispus]CCP38121.1 50S ribosomal protein L6 [Chondrus crispus]|eukprot:YP_007627374.1 50S ribosomal protein L6 (plastid) [Chondrus crispus]